MWEVSFDYGPHMSKTVKVKAGSKQEAKAKVEKAAEKSYTRGIMINWVKPVGQGVAEAGSFSYGKPPRKGSVADLAAKKRKEQERGRQPIEPKDQQVGVAKVTKGVAEEQLEETTPEALAKIDELTRR